MLIIESDRRAVVGNCVIKVFLLVVLVATIDVGQGILWVYHDCLGEFGDCMGGVFFIAVNIAETNMGGRVIGINLESLIIVRHRFAYVAAVLLLVAAQHISE